jgi:hypothetical protein
MTTGTFDLKAWALIGAQQRLRELDQERAAILAAFPQLRESGGAVEGRRRGRPSGAANAKTASAGRDRKRKRRRLSADARRRISEAVKARWARQRKAAEK